MLTDLSMSHLDGEQVFMEVRRIKPDVPVVLMSGLHREEAVSRFAGKGLAGFVQQLFQFEELGTALQQVLTVTPQPK